MINNIIYAPYEELIKKLGEPELKEAIAHDVNGSLTLFFVKFNINEYLEIFDFQVKSPNNTIESFKSVLKHRVFWTVTSNYYNNVDAVLLYRFRLAKFKQEFYQGKTIEELYYICKQIENYVKS